jgi:hypothetical protein
VPQRAIFWSNDELSLEMRPANSEPFRSMPVSRIAMVTPLPVMPC